MQRTSKRPLPYFAHLCPPRDGVEARALVVEVVSGPKDAGLTPGVRLELHMRNLLGSSSCNSSTAISLVVVAKLLPMLPQLYPLPLVRSLRVLRALHCCAAWAACPEVIQDGRRRRRPAAPAHTSSPATTTTTATATTATWWC